MRPAEKARMTVPDGAPLAQVNAVDGSSPPAAAALPANRTNEDVTTQGLGCGYPMPACRRSREARGARSSASRIPPSADADHSPARRAGALSVRMSIRTSAPAAPMPQGCLRRRITCRTALNKTQRRPYLRLATSPDIVGSNDRSRRRARRHLEYPS
jgi:hypothetical protein